MNKWIAWLRLLFVKNAPWKAISLAIAVLIYFTIRKQISYVRELTVDVAIEQENATAKKADAPVIESFDPPKVQVILRGSYEEVTQLAKETVKCLIRPRQKAASQESVSVKVSGSNLRGIRGLRVLKIEPNRINVKYDDSITLRDLSVAPPTYVGKARGIVQLTCPPIKVSVKGSRRLLEKVDPSKVQIASDPIDVDGRMQSFSTSVKLVPPSEAPNAVITPAEIPVAVGIKVDITSAKLAHVPVLVQQPTGATKWRASPEFVDVEATGLAEVVNTFSAKDIIVSVNGNIPMVAGVLTNDAPTVIFVRQGVAVENVKTFPPTVKLIAPAMAAPEPRPGKD
jgi:hypothetical protein